MRIIEFKGLTHFERYVDIGACEKHYDFICLWDLEEGEKYEDWLKRFNSETDGSKIIWLNYLLLEFNESNKESFAEIYGHKIFMTIEDNFQLLMEFNEKWFGQSFAIFNGLDLNWDDINEKIVSEKTDLEGNRTEVELEEGTIRFLDEDDTIKSFYLKESKYPDFKNEVDNIFKLFN